MSSGPGAPRTLIKNAKVVLPEEVTRTSVLLADGKIAALDPAGTITADETIDASGLHLLPGAIDDQVHFREPGLTHKEDLGSGSRACAAGGITSFLEMPNTVPQTVNAVSLLAKLALAATKCVVNYGFYIGVTNDNIEQLLEVERRLGRRTPGIKIFMGSSTGNMLVDDPEKLEAVFARTTLPIAAHCEDEATVRANQERLMGSGQPLHVSDHSRIRDRRAAVRATRRAMELANRHRHRFHLLHTSTADEVELLSRPWVTPDRVQGKGGTGGSQPVPAVSPPGPWVTAEACPHHLFFDSSDYEQLGTLVQMNPSLKDPADRERLWEGLTQGAIQVLATDHAPHTLEEKAADYPASPSGLPAVEVALPLMLDQVNRGRCTLLQLVAWMSDNPARVWDVVGKGRIAEGWDADLVLVDMAKERTVRNAEQITKCGWSPWDGMRLHGWPVRTWVGGQTVFADGTVEDEPLGTEIAFDHSRGGFWG